jgi:hypothetical protein
MSLLQLYFAKQPIAAHFVKTQGGAHSISIALLCGNLITAAGLYACSI